MKKCTISYRQGFVPDYGTLIYLVSKQFLSQPVEIGNPWSKLGDFENGGRGTLGLILALYLQ